MTKSLPITAACLLLTVLGMTLCLPPAARAQNGPPANAVVSPEALFVPANQIQPGKLPFTLRKVFSRLERDRAETMTFTESRTFAISKNPARQSGILRSSKDNGLSLSYEGSKPHVVIVDDKGLIDRKPGGSERQINVTDHPELGALTDLYLNLLRGNADKLFDYADVYFTGTAQSWQMGLISRDATVAKRAGRVIITGAGRDIQKLENLMNNGESRMLELSKPVRNPKYTPEEVQAYFRGQS